MVAKAAAKAAGGQSPPAQVTMAPPPPTPPSFRDLVSQRGDTLASEIAQALTMTMSGAGLQGTGKTLWGLRSLPTPILHLNFDREASGLFYARDKAGDLFISKERAQDIAVVTLAPEHFDESAKSWSENTARAAREKMEESIFKYLPALTRGSILLDGGTMFNNMVQLIELSQIKRERAAQDKKLFPFDYAIVNSYVNGLLGRFDRAPVNVYMTHHLTEKWGPDGPLGTYYAQQNSQVPKMFQVELWFWSLCGAVMNQDAVNKARVEKKPVPPNVLCKKFMCTIPGHQGTTFQMKVLENKLNKSLVGLTRESLTFDELFFLTFGRQYNEKPVEGKKEEKVADVSK